MCFIPGKRTVCLAQCSTLPRPPSILTLRPEPALVEIAAESGESVIPRPHCGVTVLEPTSTQLFN